MAPGRLPRRYGPAETARALHDRDCEGGAWPPAARVADVESCKNEMEQVTQMSRDVGILARRVVSLLHDIAAHAALLPAEKALLTARLWCKLRHLPPVAE